jgi:MYXO-CTERM domain-containing protein
MSDADGSSPHSKLKFSLDTWAVLLALAAAALIRLGLIQHVPW